MATTTGLGRLRWELKKAQQMPRRSSSSSSNGSHFREDFPVRDDEQWRVGIFQCWANDRLDLRTAPLEDADVPDLAKD